MVHEIEAIPERLMSQVSRHLADRIVGIILEELRVMPWRLT